MAPAVAALLHVLVFVYWLGGDLGAFCASFTAGDASRPREVRLAALKLVGDVDMAPRTALILTGPTGLTLAAVRGWLTAPPLVLALAWAAGLAWLALAWRLHLKHGAAASWERKIDQSIRWVALAGLTAAGAAGVLGLWAAPAFLCWKLLILAAAIGVGLLIRLRLRPLGAAAAALARGDVEGGAAVTRVLDRSRPLVVLIWLLITSAALLGLAQPA